MKQMTSEELDTFRRQIVAFMEINKLSLADFAKLSGCSTSLISNVLRLHGPSTVTYNKVKAVLVGKRNEVITEEEERVSSAQKQWELTLRERINDLIENHGVPASVICKCAQCGYATFKRFMDGISVKHETTTKLSNAVRELEKNPPSISKSKEYFQYRKDTEAAKELLIEIRDHYGVNYSDMEKMLGVSRKTLTEICKNAHVGHKIIKQLLETINALNLEEECPKYSGVKPYKKTELFDWNGISHELVSARERKGMSNADVARESGLPSSIISRGESQTAVGLSTLYKLCRCYGLSMDKLLDDNVIYENT